MNWRCALDPNEIISVALVKKKSKTFHQFARENYPNFSGRDIIEQHGKYRDMYYEYIKTLDLNELQLEFKNTTAYWRKECIHKLVKFNEEKYKTKYRWWDTKNE